MKPTTVAICDDQIEDAEILEQIVREILPESVCSIFSTGESLLKAFSAKVNPFQLIFLDIHMKGKNGIKTAEEIRKCDKLVPIIFVSVSQDHYKEAFDVFAYQYILKPINKLKVQNALEPLLGVLRSESVPVLYFRYRSQMYTIRHSLIKYISSSLHTVNFHLTDGKIVQCRGKLNDFSEQLQGSSFVRCHQSFFVNMDFVTSMKMDTFELGEDLIPISRSLSKDVQMQYENYLKTK